jgi:hypothetical protein
MRRPLRREGRGDGSAGDTDGDFRDWDAIDTWGAQIAGELSEAAAR